MTAQELDAQNATSRLSQVERFRSQVGIPQGKTAKNPKQAKQKITLHKIEREAIPMSRSVVSHKSATWIPGFQHVKLRIRRPRPLQSLLPDFEVQTLHDSLQMNSGGLSRAQVVGRQISSEVRKLQKRFAEQERVLGISSSQRHLLLTRVIYPN